MNNLNFKLRQLIGCMVEMELEEGRRIEAEICYVGSNFVEVKKYEIEDADPDHDENHAKKDASEDDDKKKKHCYSWIIPVDKIKYVELYHGEDCCK